ncbi:receptor-type tyrosine-protein phosphatase F-like [Babylonia areolata]|uniref:receptor-type tyrosine-protein phosphatase F-like n=1 Tax=Babylonia areolata TaxID=304850 RepID=UPI003FD1CB5C
MADSSSTSDGCDPGFWGSNCDQPCPANCLNGTCNAIGLCARCEPGFRDFKCDHECAAGSFGADCSERCSFHCTVLDCDHVTGACACRAGWQQPQCLQPCEVTTWGPNCTSSCSPGCVDQDCDAIDGRCQHGCQAGWLGDFCDERCGRGQFGMNCSQPCSGQCLDSVCNHVTGVCLGCPPGFTGDLCDAPCEAGKWGSGCIEKCSPHCGGTDKGCTSTDGICTSGCDEGFRSARCNQECAKGMYGVNCSLTCSEFCLQPKGGDAPCNHVTGYCPQGCRETHMGPSCFTQVPVSTALVGGVAAGIVVVAIVVIALVVAFIFVRRRRSPKSMAPHKREENGNAELSSAYISINHGYQLDKEEEASFDDEDEASDVGISMATGAGGEQEKQVYYNTSPEMSRTRIASHDLASCLDKLRADPMPLVEQFENLPKGLISTTEVALNAANRGKNRYKNICAYDHSRVKMNIIDGDPNSDYINASYVDGYDGQPRFIASQGPNAVILNDFLRMLWEKRVTTVVMLTNTVEAGKHKCEQYWPDSGEKKYGTVTVTLLSTRHTADYVIRILQLAKEGRKIQVTQHHFTSWPDKGVPSSPWPLVDFHMVVSAHVASQPPELPVVVHCSAGIGRTGTYIALDHLLWEASATLSLDFNTCVWKLRQARVNMIQTVEQYLFLHEAVLVGMSVRDSLYSRDSLQDVVMELSKPTAEGFTKMAAEYKRLAICQSKVDEDDYKAGREDENIVKNRYYNILPKDSHRPFLSPAAAGSSDYINAVYLPGYRKKQQFVVTQMPLAGTVLDLWRLVGEFPVSTLVIFPATPTTVGDTAPEFVPEEGQSCQYGAYKVTCRSRTQQDRYQEDFLYMVKAKKLSIRRNGRGIHVLRCEETQPGPDLVLSMAQAAMFGLPEKQLEDSLVLVVCRTGAEMSGVFVAVANLIQRLEEAAVSVPTVVGHLRTVRPQLVSSLEQYQTIYEAAKLFAGTSSVFPRLVVVPPRKPLRKGGKDRRTAPDGHASADDKDSRKPKKKEKEKGSDNAAAVFSFNGSRASGARANGSTRGATTNGSTVNTNGSSSTNGGVAAEVKGEGYADGGGQVGAGAEDREKGSVTFSM